MQLSPMNKKIIHWIEVGLTAILIINLIALNFIVLIHYGGLARRSQQGFSLIIMVCNSLSHLYP